MKNIAFIGLGAMGKRITENLISEGYSLTVYNRDQSKADSLVALGAKKAASAREAVRGAEIVMVMVTNDEASMEIWLDEDKGLMRVLESNQIAIDLSTLSLSFTKELSQIFKNADIPFIEAPVVGTRPQAEQKQLTVLTAGSEKAFHSAKVVLDAISAKAIFLGDAGRAASLKLYINSLFGIQSAAFAELTQTLRESGFNDETIMKIVPDLPVTSPIMKMMLGLMMEDKFSPLFPIDLVEKDFGYAEEFVSEAGLEPIMTKGARTAFKKAQGMGLGKDNISGIIQIYQKK